LKSLYRTPLRVYLLLGFLAALGVYSGTKLPISLFPNSNKATIAVNLSFGSFTTDEFRNTYGTPFESQLQNISARSIEVERIETEYNAHDALFKVIFKWGTDPQEALKEVRSAANAFVSQFPIDIRNSLWVSNWSGNTGFLAVSFFSQTRSLDSLYETLEPLLSPQLVKVKDSAGARLWNPAQKEIQVRLVPNKMALFGLYPRDITTALNEAMFGNSGGSVTVGLNQYDVTLPRSLQKIDDIGQIPIPTSLGKSIHLSDVSQIDLAVSQSNTESFTTSGAPSIILFSRPRPGGNIKRMAEDILDIVKNLEPSFPPDIKYKVLVDPSEFIRSAVNNVFREVLVAALLAVCVLFLFIGNLKNVVTAAIEIPLSIVLAFILMRLTGINLNLISLGGLALSAGMNVDASVVVMENIFRKFENIKTPPDYATRFKLICEAVNEVKFPVIASTMASLVVFVPLALTSGLTNALLGDLALAVVFSHSFSAVVALILVPTVRLHLLSVGSNSKSHSPMEKTFVRIENAYVKGLGYFLNSRIAKKISYSFLALLLASLGYFVIPSLPKEIIGRPDTDWIDLFVNTQGNTLVKQMEAQTEEIEARLMGKFGDKIQYTFVQTGNPNGSDIMVRLKDKSQMNLVWHDMEKYFTNTPQLFYSVSPWNPSELSIPDPPDFRLSIRGGTTGDRALVGEEVFDLLNEKKAFTHLTSHPNMRHIENVVVKPHLEQWPYLSNGKSRLLPSDLADISRVATIGKTVGYLPSEGQALPVFIQYSQGLISSVEDLASFPIGVQGKLVPMRTLADVSLKKALPEIFSVDIKELVRVEGKMSDEDKAEGPARTLQARKLVNEWKKTHPLPERVSINDEDAKIEMNEALTQLEQAVGLSVLLIFLTMVLQFGDIMSALFVLVAVPLGFIGVLSSLFIFRSTLSLNSVLGVILLNGIAVANSIILVDFLKKLVDGGIAPRTAALTAARIRLRPILMTSTTTALGMLPIALGLGEGGRILQPLGIAVVGGLGFSMLTTLFLVPTLQVGYLEWKNKKTKIDFQFSDEKRNLPPDLNL